MVAVGLWVAEAVVDGLAEAASLVVVEVLEAVEAAAPGDATLHSKTAS